MVLTPPNGQSITLAGAPEVSLLGLGQILRGPLGPAGPVGSPGTTARYEHTQSTAQTVWTVNHNFGYRPLVQALSVGGMQLLVEVLHSGQNQSLIFFDLPTAGLAVCS